MRRNSRSRSQLLNQEIPDSQDVKKSFLALGIDLDESLIDRMQRNLGTSISFDALTKASTVVSARADQHKELFGSQIMYRNAADDIDEYQEAKRPRIMQADKYRTAAILRDLHDRESALEPHTRAALDKILRSLRLSYSRSPDLFLSCLFGCPKDAKKNDNERLLLKTRYVDEEFFKEAMKRLISQPTAQSLQDFSTLLEEKKRFAEDQSRRSYDLKTTKPAHEVEFWNMKRASTPNGATNSPVRSLSASSTGRLSSKGALKAIHTIEKDSDPIPVVRPIYSTHKNATTKVASLLGRNHYEHPSEASGGKGVIGHMQSLHSASKTDVATALNSPGISGLNRAHTTRKLGHVVDFSDKSKPSTGRLFDGLAVSSLLGGRTESPPRVKVNSFMALEKERQSHDASVAHCLGHVPHRQQSTTTAAGGSASRHSSSYLRRSEATGGDPTQQGRITSAGTLRLEDAGINMSHILAHENATIINLRQVPIP